MVKVLIKLFQKFVRVEGAKPSSRPQARNDFGVSFGSFLYASGVKEKNAESHLSVILQKKENTQMGVVLIGEFE